MGKKSEKKVKSDRVNALRKQYDAFLEEDKKRKERNEFILGRLDNMRYGSAAVQIRYKPVVYGDLMSGYSRVVYRQEPFERHELISQPIQPIRRTSQQNLQVDHPRSYLEDTSLLKEISKKYILIPKLRPTLMNDYVATIPPQPLPPVAMFPPQTNVTSNDDWKSKYDILEQLKNNEKEDLTSRYVKDELLPEKEKQIRCSDIAPKVTTDISHSEKGVDSFDSQNGSIDGYNLQNYNTKDCTTKYEHEVPEKDMTFDKNHVENEPQNVDGLKIHDNKDQHLITDYAPISSISTDINPEMNTVFDNTLQNQDLEHSVNMVEAIINPTDNQENEQQNNIYYPEESLMTPEYNTGEAPIIQNANEQHLNEEPQNEEHRVQYEQPVADGEQYPSPENVYLDKEDYSPTEVLNPAEFDEHFNNTGSTVNETKEDIVNEYPVEMINVQEFTPSEDVKLVDGINVNPNYLASEKNELETNPDLETSIQDFDQTQAIKEFDAEQSEMFYSEQTDELVYDQQLPGTDPTYNQEYPDTETYPQAQDYSYYESPAGINEQEYPVAINDHEESSTRYDQNYAQQYEGYEQEYDQGQEQQQYVQSELAQGPDLSQQYQYEYKLPDPDSVRGVEQTVEGVQQVLDTEDGFVNVDKGKPIEQTE